MYKYKAKWGSIVAYGETQEEAVNKVLDNPDFYTWGGNKEEVEIDTVTEGDSSVPIHFMSADL